MVLDLLHISSECVKFWYQAATVSICLMILDIFISAKWYCWAWNDLLRFFICKWDPTRTITRYGAQLYGFFTVRRIKWVLYWLHWDIRIEISVSNCQRIASRYLNKKFRLRIPYLHIPFKSMANTKVCLFHFAVFFDHLFFNDDHLTNA